MATDEVQQVVTEAGDGRKRRPELELSNSTKLKVAAVCGEGAQKQWTFSPACQPEQAVPACGVDTEQMFKTPAVEARPSECTENSTSNVSSPSGGKDIPIFIEACAGCVVF